MDAVTKIDPKGETFYRLAAVYAEKHGGYVTIEPKSPEWRAWAAYFKSLGWVPHVMRNAAPQALTMPAKRPEEFDRHYAANQEVKWG